MTFKNVNRKRLVIRLILIILLVVLGFGLYYIGKEHEVLLDNKTVDIGGKSYEAAKFMVVTVDGKEDKSIELYADDRDVVKVSGPSHKIKVDIVNEDTEQVIKSVERSFNFGTDPKVMISLPALAEDAPDVYLPLPAAYDPDAVSEVAPSPPAEEAPKTEIPAIVE
ncbi:MAG: hypothetical protein LLF78_00990 [Synergistaceae bacterium]|nr:hypothetical protein [Synergistaceae bacterium]